MLDFSNAFNSVKRSSILNALEISPLVSVFPYFANIYKCSSSLHLENYTIPSASGVKQGDPLGPLLFCLAVHQIVVKFKESYPDFDVVGYMDDLTLIGDPCKLEEAMLFFGNLSKEIGLSLNAKKCICIFQGTCKNLVYNGVDVPFKSGCQTAWFLYWCFYFCTTNVKYSNDMFSKRTLNSL
ncbi:hypothetical protein RCL1_007781 [Eukaryota sp. TZLM3-RCL]